MGNLSYETQQTELQGLFSEVGEIREIFLPADRNTGQPRGFAFVEFTDSDAAAEAIAKFNGYELNGRRLRVNEAEERRPSVPSFAPDDRPSWGGGGGGRGGGGRPSRPKGSRRNVRGKKRSL